MRIMRCSIALVAIVACKDKGAAPPLARPPLAAMDAAVVSDVAAVSKGGMHDLVATRISSGEYRLHDIGDRFSVNVKAEPQISPPLTATEHRSKAVIDTPDYRLVVQFLVGDGKLRYDAQELADFKRELVETLAAHAVKTATDITFASKPAVKVVGRSGDAALSAIMVVVPAHDRRYLFICTKAVESCQRDVAASVTFR